MKRLIGLAALAVAGCAGTAAVQTAKTSVTGFHQAYNAGRFDQLYVESDPRFQATSTSARFATFMAALRRKLGAYRAGTATGWRDNYDTSGHSVTLTYSATYERGAATEQFVYHLDGKQARLLGFNVNSPTLLTD